MSTRKMCDPGMDRTSTLQVAQEPSRANRKVVARGLENCSSRLEAISTRLEAIATRSKDATRGSWPYY